MRVRCDTTLPRANDSAIFDETASSNSPTLCCCSNRNANCSSSELISLTQFVFLCRMIVVLELIVAAASLLLTWLWWTSAGENNDNNNSNINETDNDNDGNDDSAKRRIRQSKSTSTKTNNSPSKNDIQQSPTSTSKSSLQTALNNTDNDDNDADDEVVKSSSSTLTLNSKVEADEEEETVVTSSQFDSKSSTATTTLTNSSRRRKRYCIAMCSDFFYPNMGGVEMHIFQLAQCLIQLGHKVIVITHSYGNRKGVRYMSNGLKAYYICHRPIYNGNSLPSGILLLPILRNICIRERVDIVHSHQAFSTIGHESIMLARTMGLKTVFTDHSLFGFADASSILMNKLLKFTLTDTDHVICVSNTSKENTCLRAQIEPELVSVIPNAIDTSMFTPDPSKRHPDRSVDLMLEVIPQICAKYPNVYWIIGGDGPKRLALDEMREKHQLQDRVEMLGEVAHDNVRNVLVRGDVFLNASLTEAFCIAIVEAVSAGLSVVSTSVGGVPEVLPNDMVRLARPHCDDVVQRLCDAIDALPVHKPLEQHARVREMYSWLQVAERTEIVYDRIIAAPQLPLVERLRRYYGTGLIAGKLICIIVTFAYLTWRLLEYLFPKSEIDICIDMPSPQLELDRGEKSERN